jgi:hypothetical protein
MSHYKGSRRTPRSLDRARLDVVLPTHVAESEVIRTEADGNAAMVEAAIDRSQTRLLSRLLPDRIDKKVRTHELELLETGLDYRRRALRMAVESKLQAVEEMCNHVLMTGKSEVRRKRQEFFAEQRLQLQSALDGIAARFNDDMERRLDALERIGHPLLRDREARRLENGIDEFHATLERLTTDFLSIIEEGVSHRGSQLSD